MLLKVEDREKRKAYINTDYIECIKYDEDYDNTRIFTNTASINIPGDVAGKLASLLAKMDGYKIITLE